MALDGIWTGLLFESKTCTGAKGLEFGFQGPDRRDWCTRECVRIAQVLPFFASPA